VAAGSRAGEGKIATTDLRLFTVTDSPREAVATVRQARERRTQAFPVESQRRLGSAMTTRKEFLRGQRIDPKPITGRETVPELVDNAFLAYNSGASPRDAACFTGADARGRRHPSA